MFSSDSQVETLSQLIEMVKHNITLRKEYAKLDVVEKVVQLFSLLALILILSFIATLILLFLSASLAVWLSAYIGLGLSLLVVSMLYGVLLLTIYLSRHAWIERPLVKYLSRLLLN